MVIVPSPPPKVAVPPKPVAVEESSFTADSSPKDLTTAEATEDKPETFTIGVSDYTFNPINAIFGRSLKTPNGHIVTLAYWEQQEAVSHDEVPYYEYR